MEQLGSEYEQDITILTICAKIIFACNIRGDFLKLLTVVVEAKFLAKGVETVYLRVKTRIRYYVLKLTRFGFLYLFIFVIEV